MLLLDRRAETDVIDDLVAAVRDGMSRALVLRGEAGIGKTALLHYAAESAADFQVVRATGIESEMELDLAGVHQLVRGFEARVGRLPPPQRDALGAAFGHATGRPPDRFLVGLAVLTLLAGVAEDGPLLCIVDDAHWLDRESAEVLAFVARRLMADGVAVLFAAREPVDRPELLAGLPVLQIGGIADRQARDLLLSTAPARLDGHVADRIVAMAGGNPLALVELASNLTPAQLEGTSLLPEPLPIGGRLQGIFLQRVGLLPAGTQVLMLLAAAEPSGDPPLLSRAARHLGLRIEALWPAEAEGLVDLGSRIAFRYPLIRSAVYHGAPRRRRMRVHEALAAASDPRIDPDRRAWHLAAAAVEPDEAVAAELQRSADRARTRGGYAAAATFLSRAAELTPDEGRRMERMLAAIEAELNGGAPDRAEGLLGRATSRLVDPAAGARALRLEGGIRYAKGQLAEAPPLLLEAARRLEPVDPLLGRETMLEAIQAALYGGRYAGGGGPAAVGEAARRMPAADPLRPLISDLLLAGYSVLLTDGPAAAVPYLRPATAALLAPDLRAGDLRWFMLGCLAASELWDDQAQHALAARWVKLARDQGALTTLPVALNYLGWYEVMEGRIQAAEADLAEGQEISRAIGNPGIVGASGAGSLLRLVWRGREAEARAAAAAMSRDGIERGQGASVTHAQSALMVLELSLGNYQAAIASGRDVYEEDLLYLGSLTLPDLVEAGIRGGDRRVAGRALERLRERLLACGTPWALGVLARSEALAAEDSAAEDRYQESIERLQRCRVATDLARAHLLYGEWLRRRGRRRDARDQLRGAYEMFSSMGFETFAERARVELGATGEHARRRSVETQEDLTPQEAQIGRMVGEGARNQEIAAQLFISPSTVEYHLRKVFRKLGVSSRTQLARVVTSGAGPLQAAERSGA